MPSLYTKQHVEPQIYCFSSLNNRFGKFVQKQSSSRKIYIFILKCARWPHTPLSKLCNNRALITFFYDLKTISSVDIFMVWVWHGLIANVFIQLLNPQNLNGHVNAQSLRIVI